MSIHYSTPLRKALLKKSKLEKPIKLFENSKDLSEPWMKRYISINHNPQDHQIKAVKWMKDKISGGILNMEYGLGKTYTSLLYINLLYSMNNLVIVNLSLLTMWKEEICKFYNDRLKFILAHKDYGINLIDMTEEDFLSYDIVITTYESISSAFKHDCDFQKFKWNNVFCDEVHRIRNENTVMYEAISRIKRKKFWGLTATLIHNVVQDARNIQALIDENSIYSLSNILTMTLKDAGIKLPPLHQTYIDVDFTPLQQKYYQDYETKAQTLLSELNPKNKKTWAEFFTVMIRLRQIAIALSMLEESHEIKVEDKEGYKSPRIDKIASMIEEDEDQSVVFCFFRKSLEMITRNLRERGIRCKTIKAEHSSDKKQQYIDAFREKKYKTLLCTFKTGGLGFNLTNANRVYLCSLWWNMCTIQQAFRRCFRPGQMKETHVFYFMRKNSIENRMLDICKEKFEMAEAFLSENVVNVKESKETYKLLFNMSIN